MAILQQNPFADHPVVDRLQGMHERIARRAWQLWRRYGRPEGLELQIWLEAERQMLGANSVRPAAAPSAPGGA